MNQKPTSWENSALAIGSVNYKLSFTSTVSLGKLPFKQRNPSLLFFFPLTRNTNFVMTIICNILAW